MRAAGQQHLHIVFVLGLHAAYALAAAVLGFVAFRRHPLDVAGSRNRHHADFTGDQVFHQQLALLRHNQRPARIGIFRPDLQEFVFDHVHDQAAIGQKLAQMLDATRQLVMLRPQLVHRQIGQLIQAHLQNGPGLAVAQGEPLGQHPAGLLTVRRLTDDAHDFVDIRLRDHQALDNMVAFLGLAQLIPRPPGDHLFAMVNVRFQNLLQVQRPGAVPVNHQKLRAHRRLQRRHRIQLIEHDRGNGATTDVDHNSDADPVARQILDAGNADNALFIDQLGDLQDQHFLVDGKGDFSHDDLLPAVLLLDHGLAAQADRPAAGFIERHDRADALDAAAGREIRAGQKAHQLTRGDERVVDHRHGRIDRLAEVVRRDAGGHADADAGGAIDQQVGEARRQHARLHHLLVKGQPHLDGVLVQVRQHFLGEAFHAAFRVPVGRRRVAVNRTEIALAVNQRTAHGEVLGHADQGVVHRHVAVRVIIADHITNDLGALGIRMALGEAKLPHRIQDAPVADLEAVADVRNRPADVHAQRILQVRPVHDVFNRKRDVVPADVRRRLRGKIVARNVVFAAVVAHGLYSFSAWLCLVF